MSEAADMSHEYVSEFVGNLPAADPFGGASSFLEAHAAIQAYCSPDEQTVALQYVGGASADAIAQKMNLTIDWVHEMIIAADHQVLRGRAQLRGKRTVRAARVSEPREVTRSRSPRVVKDAPIVNHAPEVLTAGAYPFPGAPCQDVDPETFFASETSPVTQTAKEICGQCAARVACLAYALETNQGFGVWGGVSASERRSLSRRKRP